MARPRAEELEELKKTLRALVVSSPVAMDARTLLRDYHNMEGSPLPAARFGYPSPVRFLRQECQDSFLFQGSEQNPILTLIVSKQLKHIDDFVQKQKVSSNLRHKVKRRSVQERPACRRSPGLASGGSPSFRGGPPCMRDAAPRRYTPPNERHTPNCEPAHRYTPPIERHSPKHEAVPLYIPPHERHTPKPEPAQATGYTAPNANYSSRYEASREHIPKHAAPTQGGYSSKYDTTPTQEGYSSKYDTKPTQQDYSSKYDTTPTQEGYSSKYDTKPTQQDYSSKYDTTPTQEGYSSKYDTTPTQEGDSSKYGTTPQVQYSSKHETTPAQEHYSSSYDAFDECRYRGNAATDALDDRHNVNNGAVDAFVKRRIVRNAATDVFDEYNNENNPAPDTYNEYNNVKTTAPYISHKLTNGATNHSLRHSSKPEECARARGEGATSDDEDGDLRAVRGRLRALAATASSSGSDCTALSAGSLAALAALRANVRALVAAAGARGLHADDLPAHYRRHYRTELDVARFDYTSLGAFLMPMHGDGITVSAAPQGGLLLRVANAAAAAAPAPTPSAGPRAPCAASPAPAEPTDDALPGIEYEPEVFPADCMHYMASIPRLGTAGAAPGQQLEARVGEVYGPSHFWLQLLGPEHHIAMEDLMDDMTAYYGRGGQGAERRLAAAAVRVGHHCAALFEDDWHRAIIVRLLDNQRAKVRHVDYGTVDCVPTAELKPLLARWGELPAQAIRARLAGVRPPAGARRWPPAAASAFLHHVQDKLFIASVVSVDHEEEVLSVVLVDTTTDVDVRVDQQLVRAGHADAVAGASCSAREAVVRPPYELPSFQAIETAATPNYAEIHAYLCDGIALDCVPEFAAHVPPLLPPRPPPPAVPFIPVAPPPAPTSAPATATVRPLQPPTPTRSPSPPPAPVLVNRVPLFPQRPAAALMPLSAAPPPVLRPVTLTEAECNVYALLLQVDPSAAHWYMVDAISRSYASHTPLTPLTGPPGFSQPAYRTTTHPHNWH